MLACRLTSAALVFATGGITAPVSSRHSVDQEDDQSTLYYFRFDISDSSIATATHQWALSRIPFEFPVVRDEVAMQKARYVFGCASTMNFNASLGRAVKIDALVKMDVLELIERGMRNPPEPISGCVDQRSIPEVVASTDLNDPIKVFQMPSGWYAQEARFVPRKDGVDEDDGWIVTYAFDESQLNPDGSVTAKARSELWIIDAKSMQHIVARVFLPQRVPYGLHANWFSEEKIQKQRPVQSLRSLPPMGPSKLDEPNKSGSVFSAAWMGVRRSALRLLG